MPPKIRQLKAALRKAGFSYRPAKGSHTVWIHPLLPGYEVTLSGHDGDDAQRYQEKQIRDILARLQDSLKRSRGAK